MADLGLNAPLADLCAERADELAAVATALRAYTGPLPPHRILALSGQLVAQLADVERSVATLRAWLRTP